MTIRPTSAGSSRSSLADSLSPVTRRGSLSSTSPQASVGRSSVGRSSETSTTRSSSASPSTATTSFQGSLWDAFRGTPAPAAGSPSTTATLTARNTSATAPNSRTAASNQASSATAAATGTNSSRVTNQTGERGATSAIAGLRTASATGAGSSITPNAEDSGTPPPPASDPNAEVIAKVSDALRSIGWDPSEFDLQVGSIPIVFPGKPTYDYPVMWANLAGTKMPFYLDGVKQNPGIAAINISGMMGRPIMHLI